MLPEVALTELIAELLNNKMIHPSLRINTLSAARPPGGLQSIFSGQSQRFSFFSIELADKSLWR
jgi:hypothetical protein